MLEKCANLIFSLNEAPCIVFVLPIIKMRMGFNLALLRLPTTYLECLSIRLLSVCHYCNQCLIKCHMVMFWEVTWILQRLTLKKFQTKSKKLIWTWKPRIYSIFLYNCTYANFFSMLALFDGCCTRCSRNKIANLLEHLENFLEEAACRSLQEAS